MGVTRLTLVIFYAVNTHGTFIHGMNAVRSLASVSVPSITGARTRSDTRLDGLKTASVNFYAVYVLWAWLNVNQVCSDCI